MSFAYANFESIVPGGTVATSAAHAKELREAILERGSAIGLDLIATIPAEVSATTPITYGWLDGMRTAIAAVVTEGKYGRLVGSVGSEVWTAWTLADLLTEVHDSFTNCGSGDGWISVSQYDPPLATHIRELYYACEVLAYAETSTPTWPEGPYGEQKRGSGTTTTGADTSWDGASWGSGGPDSGDGADSVQHDMGSAHLWSERCYCSIQVNGTKGVKELWVGAGRYDDYTGYAPPVPTFFLGSSWGGTPLETRLQNAEGPYLGYVKCDFSGESGGGIRTDVTFGFAWTVMSTPMGDWSERWSRTGEHGEYMYIRSVQTLGATMKNYIARFNFTKSKFLWTM